MEIEESRVAIASVTLEVILCTYLPELKSISFQVASGGIVRESQHKGPVKSAKKSEA